MQKFFDVVTDDTNFANRWFLDEPLSDGFVVIDTRLFGYGVPYEGIVPRRIPIRQEGVQVAFNLGAFDTPIVSQAILERFPHDCRGDYETFPVTVGNGVSGFSILNVVRRVACVDEERSICEKWVVEDERPDKIGCYRAIGDLHIIPSLARGLDIFRIEGWEVALIVSERLKESIERIQNLGIEFVPVT